MCFVVFNWPVSPLLTWNAGIYEHFTKNPDLVFFFLKMFMWQLSVTSYICPLPLCFSPAVPPSPQFSLLSEVRGLVTPQDLEHFDALVLRREIQALKARQGMAGATALQPDSLSMVSYPDTLTSSSASFMTNTTLSSARVGGVYECHCYLM